MTFVVKMYMYSEMWIEGQKVKKRRFALPKNGTIHSEDASKPYCHNPKLSLILGGFQSWASGVLLVLF